MTLEPRLCAGFVSGRFPDPGAAAAAIEVRNISTALKAIKAGGGSVLSMGGRPVEGRNLAFARDPSGVLLEVIEVTR